ncbi:MAG: xylulokinase [Candidatus Caldatribacteriota bacterium]|nr:xylulokinase [Candidatus Caldatribacteriota bacterium]
MKGIKMDYLLGIDIGTSGTKGVLMDREGKIYARAGREYSIDIPQPGWAEQDTEMWWEATIQVIREVIKKPEVKPQQIRGIGLSGQMHGTVFLDKNLQPFRPAIIWADQRSSSQCEFIYQKIGKERLAELTGNPVATGFMCSTLLWMKENQPEMCSKIYKVILAKDYIRYRLTGNLGVEVTDASSTLLLDIKRRCWSEELLNIFDLPLKILPEEVHESQEVAGYLLAEAVRDIGLLEGTPVVYGGGDQSMQAIGNGVIRPGILSSTIGTGGQLFITVDKFTYDPKLRIHTFCHAIPNTYHLLGAILSAGLSLKWLRENILQTPDSYRIFDGEVEKIRAGSEGIIFLPYLLGERSPYMNPQAKGVFFGLSLKHHRVHLIRAVMEGTVFALRDCLEAFEELGVKIEQVIASGGGAKSRVWRQMQADIFNKEISMTQSIEQAAMGAAILAGVGVGIYKDVEDGCKKVVKLKEEKIKPIPENVDIYHKQFEIFKSLYQDLKQDFKRLKE